MIDFGFLLKTYKGDYHRAERLINSYKQYNMDHIPLFLVCPEMDVELFNNLKDDEVSIISEEKVYTNVFTEDNRFSKGYLNQEVYKLAFWEMKLCANYMCIDSDGLFIRPFFKWEFMFDDKTPYTILEEDNDLRADWYYNELYWNGRRAWISKIEDEIDFHPCHLLTCHGFQIFSAKVLKSLKEEFMKPKGYDYKELIQISPYEFSWYNLWLQKTNVIDIHPIGCLFKYFHLKQHHIEYVLSGMKLEDWAKAYVGIIVNSNYGIGKGDYYDLSVYDGNNAGIQDDIIERNYKFYKRLRKGRLKRKIQALLLKVRYALNGVMAYVKGR